MEYGNLKLYSTLLPPSPETCLTKCLLWKTFQFFCLTLFENHFKSFSLFEVSRDANFDVVLSCTSFCLQLFTPTPQQFIFPNIKKNQQKASIFKPSVYCSSEFNLEILQAAERWLICTVLLAKSQQCARTSYPWAFFFSSGKKMDINSLPSPWIIGKKCMRIFPFRFIDKECITDKEHTSWL